MINFLKTIVYALFFSVISKRSTEKRKNKCLAELKKISPHDCVNRCKLYEKYGFELALKDENPNIRLEAYRHLGLTEEAKKDEDIRRESKKNFVEPSEVASEE